MGKLKSMMFMMGAMMASMDTPTRNNHTNRIGESKEEREKRLEDAKIKQYKAKGMQEFSFPKGKVWAINYKSAVKKALRKHYNL